MSLQRVTRRSSIRSVNSSNNSTTANPNIPVSDDEFRRQFGSPGQLSPLSSPSVAPEDDVEFCGQMRTTGPLSSPIPQYAQLNVRPKRSPIELTDMTEDPGRNVEFRGQVGYPCTMSTPQRQVKHRSVTIDFSTISEGRGDNVGFPRQFESSSQMSPMSRMPTFPFPVKPSSINTVNMNVAPVKNVTFRPQFKSPNQMSRMRMPTCQLPIKPSTVDIPNNMTIAPAKNVGFGRQFGSASQLSPMSTCQLQVKPITTDIPDSTVPVVPNHSVEFRQQFGSSSTMSLTRQLQVKPVTINTPDAKLKLAPVKNAGFRQESGCYSTMSLNRQLQVKPVTINTPDAKVAPVDNAEFRQQTGCPSTMSLTRQVQVKPKSVTIDLPDITEAPEDDAQDNRKTRNTSLDNARIFVPGDINLRFFLTSAAALKIVQFILGIAMSTLEAPIYFTCVLYLATISSLFWIWVYFASFNRKPENGQLSNTWIRIELLFAIDWFVMYDAVSVLTMCLEQWNRFNLIIILGLIAGCLNGLDVIRLVWICLQKPVEKVAIVDKVGLTRKVTAV